MDIAGIIAEYNPFHNGHKYHIEKTRQLSGCSCIAVCMSGSFVQRGEPAVYDKWTRASQAISGGADLVIELPAVFSLRSAEGFAKAGVYLLHNMGVKYLSFGSECGDIKKLSDAASLSETDSFNSLIKTKVQNGKTYASAFHESLSEIDPSLCDIFSTPNNVLAVEYVKALTGTEIVPLTLKRSDDGYNSDIPKGCYASASCLRKMLLNGEDISSYSSVEQVPVKTIYDFEEIILYSVLTADYEIFDCIPETVMKRIQSSDKSSLQSLMDTAKSKNISMASVKRALLNIMIRNSVKRTVLPSYINVLAFNDKGAKIIKAAKNTSRLPIITRPASYKENDLSFKIETLATDIYFMKEHMSMRHLKTPPVIR